MAAAVAAVFLPAVVDVVGRSRRDRAVDRSRSLWQAMRSTPRRHDGPRRPCRTLLTANFVGAISRRHRYRVRWLCRFLAVVIACVVISSCTAGSRAPDPQAASPSSARTDGASCHRRPLPFRVTSLPRGFSRELLPGSGLFRRGAVTPEGFIAYHAGPRDTHHLNFALRSVPYPPTSPEPLVVLRRHASIGRIEGGWAVDFIGNGCRYRMLAFGVNGRSTKKVAEGLRPR